MEDKMLEKARKQMKKENKIMIIKKDMINEINKEIKYWNKKIKQNLYKLKMDLDLSKENIVDINFWIEKYKQKIFKLKKEIRDIQLIWIKQNN
jgi:predicted  nucleic acid-binding Zn-ribbon protein